MAQNPKKFLSEVDFNAAVKLAGSAGTAGQVLISSGTGSTPVWSTAPGTGAMNYAQTQAAKQTTVSASGVTLVSASITTNGYPVQVLVTGDAENSAAGGWVRLQLHRDSTAIGKIIHVESSAASENIPYALTVIDTPAAGTYTYSLKTVSTAATGTFNYGETDGPVLTAIELAGPKGDTGAAGTANTFATISTPSGTSPVADSATDTLTLTAGTGITITGDATADSIAIGTNAASANGASTIVLRNASGDFAAGSITATLIGTASYATTINAISQVTGLQTALDDKLAKTPTLLGGSEDLNTKTTPGLYHQNSNADAGTGSNYPVSLAGMLYVMVGEGFYYQTYHTYTNRFFHRQYYNTVWSAWDETVGTGDTGTVSTNMIAASAVTNAKLANTAVSLGSQTLTLGAAATTALSGLTGVSSTTFTSTVATGTAPFTVSSNTMVTNLNADLLEGYSPSTANAANTIVLRDATGNFSANVVTAVTLFGSASGLTSIPAANISGTMSSALNLRTGSTTTGTAPIYMTGGGVLTNPIAGAVEYDGTVFYTTPNAVTGRAVDVASYYYVSDGAYSIDFAASAAAKSIFGSATTGLKIAAGTTYEFELTVFAQITYGGVTTPNFSHSFLLTAANGTPTTTIYQQIQLGNTTTTGLTTPVTLTSQRNANNATVIVLASVTTGSRYATYTSKGIIRVTGTAGHTVEIAPAITSSTTSVDYGFTAQAGSYFKITPIGNGTVAGVGIWA